MKFRARKSDILVVVHRETQEIGKDEAHTEYVSVHLRMKWYLIKDMTDMM